MGKLGYVSDDVYHSSLIKGISRSRFLSLAESPVHFNNPPVVKGKALDLGGFNHCLVNDSLKYIDEHYAISPQKTLDLRTKAGDKWKKEVLEPFLLKNENKTIISYEDAEMSKKMAMEVFKYKSFKIYQEGEKEIAFQGQIQGFEIEEGYKIKVDSLNEDKQIFFDYKTIDDIENARGSSYKRDYFLQAYFYQQVLFDVYGVYFKIGFIFVEKKLNPRVRFILVSDKELEHGQKRFEKLFLRYKFNEQFKDKIYNMGWENFHE